MKNILLAIFMGAAFFGGPLFAANDFNSSSRNNPYDGLSCKFRWLGSLVSFEHVSDNDDGSENIRVFLDQYRPEIGRLVHYKGRDVIYVKIFYDANKSEPQNYQFVFTKAGNMVYSYGKDSMTCR